MLIGPQGEGKTFAAAIAMAVHADRYAKHQLNKWQGNIELIEPMRGVIIRDSLENIKRHTIPSIKKALRDSIQFVDDSKRMLGPGMDITLMGIGDTGALGKLQYGAEYTFAWLEEPAPMIEGLSSGISQDAFDAAIARAGRQTHALPRVQVTMNPPEEDHWTYPEFYENPRFPNAMFPDITLEVIQMSYGENVTLTDIQRQMAKAAWANNPSLWQRFVEGKPAFTTVGAAVTSEYNEDTHRTKRDVKLDPMEGHPVFRFWDGGLNPTCLFMQITPRGYWHFLDTLRGENIGMKQLIRSRVKPLIATRYNKIVKWRDIGDPSLSNREQSDSDYTGARVIEEELGTHFENGTIHWEPRREAIKQALQWMIDGEPMIKLSWHEGILHRALRGGWHYRKTIAGKILKDKPEKDIHSHPGDSFSYGIERLFGGQKIDYEQQLLIEKAEKGFAASYA
ncbi:MAG: hypothetical protein BV459_03825 [Thermoplasmata archaeon M11B2D]|nr:MAG: hypothetical protein BV459_03825 [Thermoplasmata archaeon M11B2D]